LSNKLHFAVSEREEVARLTEQQVLNKVSNWEVSAVTTARQVSALIKHSAPGLNVASRK
jgi:hypothetical protein